MPATERSSVTSVNKIYEIPLADFEAALVTLGIPLPASNEFVMQSESANSTSQKLRCGGVDYILVSWVE